MVKVCTYGRLTREPEYKDVNGSQVTVFDIAADAARNPDGTNIPNFFRVSVWGKRGEACQKHLHKADAVMVIGDLFLREYTKSDGSKATAANINNAEVTFGARALANQNKGESQAAPAQTPVANIPVAPEDDDGLPF